MNNSYKVTLRSRDRFDGTTALWSLYFPILPQGKYKANIQMAVKGVAGITYAVQMKSDALNGLQVSSSRDSGWYSALSVLSDQGACQTGVLYFSNVPDRLDVRLRIIATDTAATGISDWEMYLDMVRIDEQT